MDEALRRALVDTPAMLSAAFTSPPPPNGHRRLASLQRKGSLFGKLPISSTFQSLLFSEQSYVRLSSCPKSVP
jgi:hypothetical protein